MELHYLGLVPLFLMIVFIVSGEINIEWDGKRSLLLGFIATLIIFLTFFGGLAWFIKEQKANAEQVQINATVEQSKMRSCIESCGYEF